jgi:hypothetical protein
MYNIQGVPENVTISLFLGDCHRQKIFLGHALKKMVTMDKNEGSHRLNIPRTIRHNSN